MQIIASVDWEAVGAVATGCAMLVTAAMAVFTARMAAATDRMAKAAQAQIDVARRQADAAETSVEQTERTISATMDPKLRAQRITGNQIAATMDTSGFSILLVNDGPVTATIREAKLTVAPQPVFLEPVPGGAIEPKGQMLVRSEPNAAQVRNLAEQQSIPVSLLYDGPGGNSIYTRLTIKRKSPGSPDERWLVTERETDKPYGSDPLSS